MGNLTVISFGALISALMAGSAVSHPATYHQQNTGQSSFVDSGGAQSRHQSQWVYFKPGSSGKGHLSYKLTPGGDRIMDFSTAGYRGGGTPLPQVPVKIKLSINTGLQDQSAPIQKAIDSVSALPLINGFRGTVLLARGIFKCSQTLRINASGVVLRGSGSADNGTIIEMTGAPHNAVALGTKLQTRISGPVTQIKQDYVPSGTDHFLIADASTFKKGDLIRITKTVTPVWVKFMGMDQLFRNGKAQTWLNGELSVDREIKAIDGHQITLTVPLTDSYDSRYFNPPGINVQKIEYANEVSDIGLESLQLRAKDQTGTINQQHDRAFTLAGLRDGWVRDIKIINTVNSISVTGRSITLEDIDIIHNLPTTGAAKPADINGSGSGLLFNKCRIQGDNVFFFATGAKICGPIVLLNCIFTGNGWIQPHQRWATGVLVDNCQVPQGGIDFMNRGEYGSGHGWAIGWSVAWNCQAAEFLNQMPPGSYNWVIGSQGQRAQKPMPFQKKPEVPEGIYDSHGEQVTPQSLYLAQLEDRLGPEAVHNTGYKP